jgi:chromosome segregation ATPase
LLTPTPCCHSYFQVEQLQNELAQYELAYQEIEAKNSEFEREVTLTAEQLQKSENMRRRLNDQVTELQGQLAIEEQRSKFCSIL